MKFTDFEDGIMSFGKHKGTKIEELPDDYILWAYYNLDPGDVKALIDAEYVRREFTPSKVYMSFGKHEGSSIHQLPDEYLKWCSENLDNDALMHFVEIEIEERDDGTGQWWNA